jgi:protein subunit release factor B
MTLARRPPPYRLDRATLETEVRLDVMRASGAGGQHLHKTESAVRLTHFPSGVVVLASDTRSQQMNRELAFERLIERLRKLNFVPKKRKKTKPTFAAKKRRLEGKRREGSTKRLRGRVRDAE